MKHVPLTATLGVMSLVIGSLGHQAKAQAQPTPASPTFNTGQLPTSFPLAPPLKTRVEGRLVDEQGRPVAGALVAALGYDTLTRAGETIKHIVITDAQGHFVLEGLKVGGNRIGAARGRDFGAGTTTVAETSTAPATPALPLVIHLTRGEAPVPPEDWEAGFAFITAHAPTQDTYDGVGWRALYKLIPHDPARTLALMDDHKTLGSDDMMANVFVRLAAQDPALAVRWGHDRIGKGHYPDSKRARLLSFTLSTAEADPQNARNAYFYLINTDLTDLSPEHANDFAFLAALAARLKDPDAQQWLQVLMAAVTTMSERVAAQYVAGYSNTLAEGSPALAQTFIAKLSPVLKLSALAGAIPTIGKSDPATALKLIADMEALAARPDVVQVVNAPRADHSYQLVTRELLNTAYQGLAQALLNTDPQAAFALALKIKARSEAAVPLMVQAAARLPHAAALTALRAAFALAQTDPWPFDPVDLTTLVAGATMPLDAKLGEAFFAEARGKLEGHDPDPSNPHSLGMRTDHYALRRAESCPEEARLLLENEWQRVTTLLRTGPLGHVDMTQLWTPSAYMHNAQVSYLFKLATAMGVLSRERTQEMIVEAQSFDNDKRGMSNYDGVAVQDRILNWIIASEVERRTTWYNY